jgi:hypothetical protein
MFPRACCHWVERQVGLLICDAVWLSGCAGVVVALVLVQRDRHMLRTDNDSFHNATLYAERNTCPNFLDPGQATLASNRMPSSQQPNILEELTVPEIAAVRMPRRIRHALYHCMQ